MGPCTRPARGDIAANAVLPVAVREIAAVAPQAGRKIEALEAPAKVHVQRILPDFEKAAC